MEDIKQFKIKLETNGNLQIESSEKLTTDEIQPILDTARLNQKTHYLYQKELDKQHQIYTTLIALLLCLGLFSISFVIVRTVRNFKTSQIEVIKLC